MTPSEIDGLVSRFKSERCVEGDRYRYRQGVMRISAFNPRRTQEKANLRHEDLMKHIRIWSKNWWEKRGLVFKFESELSTSGHVEFEENLRDKK